MDMRFLSAAVAVAMVCVACTSRYDIEERGVDEPHKVLFDEPVVDLTVRGENVIANGGRYPTTWNFTASAIKHTGNFTTWSAGESFMDHVDCGYNASVLSWDPQAGSAAKSYSWPSGAKLTTQAFSPTSWGATIGSNGVSKAGYTLATDGSQIDLLYSNRALNQTKATATSHYDPASRDAVQLQFRHALSLICFKVKKRENYLGFTFTLDSIYLKDMAITGSFAQNLTDGGSTAADDSPTWTTDAMAPLGNYDNIMASEPFTVTSYGAAEAAALDGTAKDLLVMPQTLNANARFVISYSFFHTSGGTPVTQTYTIYLKDLLYDGVSGSSATFPGLEVGKQYTYTIILERARILFEPVVTRQWTEIHVNDLLLRDM